MKHLTSNAAITGPVRAADAARVVELGSGRDTIALVSGELGFAGVSIVRSRLGPGSDGAPPHVHRRTTELFHVLDGAVNVLAGEDLVALHAGDALQIEPGVVHAFAAPPGRSADLLIAAAPGAGRSGYFRLLDRVRRGLVDHEWLLATGEYFDVTFSTSDTWSAHRADQIESTNTDPTPNRRTPR